MDFPCFLFPLSLIKILLFIAMFEEFATHFVQQLLVRQVKQCYNSCSCFVNRMHSVGASHASFREARRNINHRNAFFVPQRGPNYTASIQQGFRYSVAINSPTIVASFGGVD